MSTALWRKVDFLHVLALSDITKYNLGINFTNAHRKLLIVEQKGARSITTSPNVLCARYELRSLNPEKANISPSFPTL